MYLLTDEQVFGLLAGNLIVSDLVRLSDDTPLLITTGEAARVWCRAADTVRDAIEDGRLRARYSAGRHLVYTSSCVALWGAPINDFDKTPDYGTKSSRLRG
jgi:hypothetical protein